MTPIEIGLLFIGLMVLLFLSGVPVAVAMGLAGVVGFAVIKGSTTGAVSILAADFIDNFSAYSFTPLVLFGLMGILCFESGITRDLYHAMYTILGNLAGGLGIATTAACALFAAITGSSNASAIAMGKVTFPEMKKYKYDMGLAAGCVASAGCLGILIPPSGVFIMYGVKTGNSISKLFAAGIVPGIILALLMCVVVYFECRINPQKGPAGGKTTLKEKIKSLVGIIDMAIVFIVVIVGLMVGWFTATQAGAIGAAVVFIIGLVKRRLNFRHLWKAFKDTVEICCLSMAIVAGAAVFGHFLAITTIPNTLATAVANSGLSLAAISFLIILFYFVGGCFMDSLAMILLTIPVTYPLILSLGLDPIWFGVIIVVTAEMGLISPPVGLNVYVVANLVPEVPMGRIFKNIFPFLLCMVALAVLLVCFPAIATWLPSQIQ